MPVKMDFRVLENWQQTCQVFHSEQCQPASLERSVLSSILNVIDCRKREATRDPQKCKYAALSYV